MSPIRMSRPESAIRIVLSFNEFFNRRDVEEMVRLLSEDCVIEDSGPGPDGNRYAGRAAVKEYFENRFDRFPGLTHEIEEVFGFGARCVVLWKRGWRGNDGKNEYVRGADMYQVKNDAICEILSYTKGG